MNEYWLSLQPVCLTNFWSTLRLSKGLYSHPQSILQAPVQTRTLSPCAHTHRQLCSYLLKYLFPCWASFSSVPVAKLFTQCLAKISLDACMKVMACTALETELTITMQLILLSFKALLYVQVCLQETSTWDLR